MCLQEIRRHLRQKRPQDTTSYDASLEETDDDDNTEREDGEVTDGGIDVEEEEGEEEDEEEDVDEGGIENYEGLIIKEEEAEVETATESKIAQEEVRQVENQTRRPHDYLHHRTHHRGNQHKGRKRVKEDPVTTEESIRHSKPVESKFDESLFEEYDSETSVANRLVTTERSTYHHRHHHSSPTSRPQFYQPFNLTTAQPAHVDAPVEVTLDYLDFNITEGPTTESSAVLSPVKPSTQPRVKLPKPTSASENKVRQYRLISEDRNIIINCPSTSFRLLTRAHFVRMPLNMHVRVLSCFNISNC